MKKLITTASLLIAVIASAQYRDRDSNRIGINVGLSQFTLNSSDVDASPGNGWNAGLSMRGNWYNNFDMVYGIQFSENNFKVASLAGAAAEDVEFKLASAQISLLLSYKIVESHLSVEIGPMFQINGKLTLDESDESNIISGTALTAKEFADISKFSFYPTIGITGGLKQFRLNITYQYGVTNMLGSLDGDIKGNGSILAGNIIFYI